jgi:excisionase family DNA binding protein
MHSNEVRKMLATPQAANYVGLGKSTLDKARLSGNGPRFVKLGRRVLYDPTDLDAWLNQHRRSSTSDNSIVEAPRASISDAPGKQPAGASAE